MSLKRCEIIEWDLIGTWKYDVENDECIICRNNIMESCIECSNINKSDNCLCSKSSCNCYFHTHCINKWLKYNKNCPKHTTIKLNHIKLESM
jgi:RING-box protein 1